MTDDSSIENGLPPKLDLRKKVISPLGAAPSGGVPAGIRPASASPVPAGVSTVRPILNRAVPPVTPAVPSPLPSAVPPSPVVPAEGGASSAVAGATPGEAPRPLFRPVMAPQTIKLKKPLPIGMKRESTEIRTDPGAKRITSRVPLPPAPDEPTEAVPVGTKTIRIAPSQAASAVPAGTGENAEVVVPPLTPAMSPDPKRQTSRISLESVLGSGGPAPSPKTIKLQRPAAASSTIRVQGVAEPVPDSPGIRQKTAPVVLPEEGADTEKPDSEKKTIKVKRPSVRSVSRPSVAGATGEAGTADRPMTFAPPVALAASEDRVHWTFVVTACAATVVSFVLVYVLLAQVLGPNVSLTEHAYWAPGTELAWPGRIKP